MESAKTDPSQCENSGCLPTQLEHDGFIFHVQVEALHATRTTLNDLSYQGLVFVLIMIGLATGTLTGLTGASGMSILISALLLAGIEIREVIGLTFVITLVNAGIALSSYWRHDRVDVRCGLFVALPAMGAVLLGHFFSGAVEARWLTTVMIACLLIIGFKFLIAPADPAQSEGPPVVRPHAILLVLMGCVAGFVMGVMGGGGAVFIGVALILLFKLEATTAIGTSILIMGLAAIPGVVTHWYSETIRLSYAVPILASSIPAAFASSWWANRVSKRLVKRLLGIYLVVISAILLCRTLL